MHNALRVARTFWDVGRGACREEPTVTFSGSKIAQAELLRVAWHEALPLERGRAGARAPAYECTFSRSRSLTFDRILVADA